MLMTFARPCFERADFEVEGGFADDVHKHLAEQVEDVDGLLAASLLQDLQ